MTSWNSQQGEGMYSIQFETDDRELYKIVEKACQKAIDAHREKRILSQEYRLVGSADIIKEKED